MRSTHATSFTAGVNLKQQNRIHRHQQGSKTATIETTTPSTTVESTNKIDSLMRANNSVVIFHGSGGGRRDGG
jgi:hypothetical protein